MSTKLEKLEMERDRISKQYFMESNKEACKKYSKYIGKYYVYIGKLNYIWGKSFVFVESVRGSGYIDGFRLYLDGRLDNCLATGIKEIKNDYIEISRKEFNKYKTLAIKKIEEL